MAPLSTEPTTADRAATLLALVQQIATELHPRRSAARRVTLDSTLDRDLGLDSLARMELLNRIERELGVAFPERVFSEAETPRDLLRELGRAQSWQAPETAPIALPGDGAEVLEPRDAATLIDALTWHAGRHAERTTIHLYDDSDRPLAISYGELLGDARHVAARLLQAGLQPGETVAIMLPTCRDYFPTLFGVLMAGGVAVPIYPPWRMTHLEQYFNHQRRILDNCRAAMLVTFREAERIAKLLESRVATLRTVVRADALTAESGSCELPRPSADDVAVLQYTSGSTGSPKGVTLSHANILANLRAMGEANDVLPDDTLISWLPLYHDMGLIGACMGTMYFGMPLAVMSPLSFLARPLRWLRAIDRHRGTISGAPNFAYELCLKKISEDDLAGLDLGSWRLAVNAAEPVSPETIERFCTRFARYGFKREAMTPVYGLAESSVGLTFPPPGRGPMIDRIDREAFSRSGKAIPVGADHDDVLRFVACGQPVPGHEVRIVDPTGRELPDRRQGRLQFRGPSATGGYFRNPEATKRLFDGEWLETGDLGYVADGDVYISARIKDIIIRAGRNLYPAELEEAIGNLPGIRKGCVAVFGHTDPAIGTERLVVMAETREEEPAAREQLVAAINEAVIHLVQAPPDDVLLVAPHTVAKTSSGKIRRAASRELYIAGVDRKTPSMRWQVARLVLASVGPTLRRAGRVALDWLYGFYAWKLSLLTGLFVLPAVVVLPSRAWRRRLVGGAVRFLSWALAIPIAVEAPGRLPALDRGCVIVANHASYIDGWVLLAVLRGDFLFVAKRELAQNPFVRLLLDRIGSVFVDRLDRERSLEDSDEIVRAACAGTSFMFFPEGGFERPPGLIPFRTGAFLTAASANVPVLPVALRGTRSILRSDSWLPRRGQVRVIVGEPIEADEGDDWATALKLRDAARRQILSHCGEPDLGRSPLER